MRRVAVALCAALLAAGAGCTRVGETGGAQPGVLRFGSVYEPDSLNPLYSQNQAADDVASLLYEPLFRYDEHGDYVPAAATVVPTRRNGGISADGKTITLHLRAGMRWSDGAPYDGRDLVFTWRAVMDPHSAAKSQDGWDDVASMTLHGDDTVVVRLKRVEASILGIFALGGAGYPPLPAHLLAHVADLRTAAFNAAPISSGPFVLTAWNHGSSLEFAPNPDYWRGPPGLRVLSYRIVPNADTLFDQLRTHEVDAVDGLGENEIPELGTLRGVRITRTLSANWRRLAFNLRRPVLRDVRVRRAVAEAVDWGRMNRTIFHGYNRRATSDIVPISWAAPSIPPYPLDVAGARALLDAAGWRVGPGGVRRKDGVPLAFTVSTTNAKLSNIQSEEQMQQDLRRVGIALTIKNYPASLLFARDGPIYTGRYDTEFTIETNGPDPDNEGYWSGAFAPPHGGDSTFLNDPVVNRTSRAAASTFDRARRKALYQIEESRIHDLVPAVFFYWQTSYAAVDARMRGWRPATYITDFWNAWEWRIE